MIGAAVQWILQSSSINCQMYSCAPNHVSLFDLFSQLWSYIWNIFVFDASIGETNIVELKWYWKHFAFIIEKISAFKIFNQFFKIVHLLFFQLWLIYLQLVIKFVLLYNPKFKRESTILVYKFKINNYGFYNTKENDRRR